jgi:hypothetical protein
MTSAPCVGSVTRKAVAGRRFFRFLCAQTGGWEPPLGGGSYRRLERDAATGQLLSHCQGKHYRFLQNRPL